MRIKQSNKGITVFTSPDREDSKIAKRKFYAELKWIQVYMSYQDHLIEKPAYSQSNSKLWHQEILQKFKSKD